MTKSAFVIMPFGKHFESIYLKVISPPLIAAGYTVARADSLKDRSNIIKKIITGMKDADIIVADLTDNNANVFYELGICHAKGKRVIMITQSIDDVPFDLKQYVLEPYSRDFDEVERFKDKFKDLLDSLEVEPILFENPVIDFWSPSEVEAAVSKPIDKTAIESASSDYPEEDNYEDGIIDVRMRLDGASEAMKETMENLPHIFSKFTQNIERHGTDIERAGKAKSTVLVHRAMSESADTLSEFSREMHLLNADLEAQTIEFNASLIKLRELSPNDDPSEQAAARELLSAIEGALEGGRNFHSSLQGTRKLNMSKVFNRAADKAISEIDIQIRIINSIKYTICQMFENLCEQEGGSAEITQQIN